MSHVHTGHTYRHRTYSQTHSQTSGQKHRSDIFRHTGQTYSPTQVKQVRHRVRHRSGQVYRSDTKIRHAGQTHRLDIQVRYTAGQTHRSHIQARHTAVISLAHRDPAHRSDTQRDENTTTSQDNAESNLPRELGYNPTKH